MRNSIILGAIVVLLSACGGDAGSDVPDSGAQPLTAPTTYVAANGFVSLPNLANNLCFPVFMAGNGAASQSNIVYPGSVPECGGMVSIGSTTATAYPNSCVTPNSAQAGAMQITVRCQPLSDFGPVTFGSTSFSHMWNPTGALEHVSSGLQMLPIAPTFNTTNICYLSGVGSMSVGNETAWITYDGSPAAAWLNADGFKGLSVSGRCSRLGRAGGAVATVHAYPGSPGTGIAVSTGVCVPTQINGALDNGYVYLDDSGTNWVLSVSGQVGYARAECYTYL